MFRRLTMTLLVSLAAAGGVCNCVFSQQLAFELPSGDKVMKVAAGESEATAVVFLGAECPMARSYSSVLSKLQEDYRERGLRVLGIFSNSQDSQADLALYAVETETKFSLLLDPDNQIADRYAAARTPEAFLLDKDLKLRYQGRIDDRLSPGVVRQSATREDLRLAVEQLLAGKPVAIRETPVTGCIIGRVKDATQGPSVSAASITYTRDIAPLLQRNCIECHRQGEIGPFAMDSYDEVLGWADTMLETIDNGRMPPWHAAPAHRALSNDRHMSDEDKRTFREWIAAGLPEGDASDLPPPLKFTDGWLLPREPDQIIEMRDRPFIVPRDGTVEYQYFVVDPGFEEDRWISGSQVIPGIRSVVHHCLVFVRPPDASEFRGLGWIGGYTPGQRLEPLPTGYARKVPAGSKFVFQMHYTPNGTEQADVTKIGVIFEDPETVTHRVHTLVGIEQEFEIPPHAENHSVRGKLPWFPPEGQLLSVTPHMHFRGKSFKLFTDEGRSQVLLDVPNYDFNWQHTYEFAEPLQTSDIEQLAFEAVFDNSSENPFNPDPETWVTWGDQTWEEMAVAFFVFAEPLHSSDLRENSIASNAPGESSKETPADVEAKIQRYIDKVLAELDKNQDGVIRQTETGIILRRWNFKIWDEDGDGLVTPAELRLVAEKLYL